MVKSARASYYPRIAVAVSANQAANGSAFRSRGADFSQGLVGTFRSGVSVSANVPIDIAGIIGRRVQSARIAEDISELSLEQSRNSTIADAQIAYLNTLRAQRAVELDEKVMASIVKLIGIAAKQAPPILSFLGLELSSARQALTVRRGQLDTVKDNLKRSLGLDPDVDLVLTSSLPPPSELTSLAAAANATIEDRRDLEIAMKRVSQADLAVVQASDFRRPSISAGVYLDQSFGGKFVTDTGDTATRSIGLNLSLNLPLFNYDAGQSGNSKKIARLQAEQARADLRDARRQALYELKQAEAGWRRAVEQLKNLPNLKDASAGLAFAERNLLSASKDDAPSRLAQLSNARATWRNAEEASSNAAADLASAAIALRKAQGRVLNASDILQPRSASDS